MSVPETQADSLLQFVAMTRAMKRWIEETALEHRLTMSDLVNRCILYSAEKGFPDRPEDRGHKGENFTMKMIPETKALVLAHRGRLAKAAFIRRCLYTAMDDGIGNVLRD